jgi:YegS/Rv2252/BmrU family lipid kinase
MKTRFIFNPCSGRNRRRPRLAADLQAFVAAQQLDAAIVFTECPGHATELARAALADGCERIVAVGGDGTMNETAQALVGSPAALALVPCGSGNGLALHLGLPTQPRRSLALLADATARVVAIDTGTANGHPFFNAMGLGFDAEISRRFNRLTRRGLPAYARTGLAAFLRHRPEQVTVSDNNGTRETFDAFIVAVANSDQYGNHAQLAPRARVDDGLLDLVAVRPPGLLGALPLVARLFLGTFDQSPRVWRLRGSHFVVERPTPGLIHTDGETHLTAAAVTIVVRPRSLRLLVPAGCRIASSI